MVGEIPTAGYTARQRSTCYAQEKLRGGDVKMLNKDEILEKYQKGELEKTTWEEFLSSCDASHYSWTQYPEDVVHKQGDYLVVRVNLSDDPDIDWGDSMEFDFLSDNERVVDWGIPIIITDYENSNAPYAFMILEKTEKGYLPVSGSLFPTQEEAEEELKEILEEGIKNE